MYREGEKSVVMVKDSALTLRCIKFGQCIFVNARARVRVKDRPL